MSVKQPLNAQQLRERLERRYSIEQGWMLFTEVGLGTGRIADGYALGLWGSRGYALHGFEIKASRSDLLAELKQPEKADPLIQRCDYWWLVLGSSDLAEGFEIPESWGVLVPRSRGLGVARQAERTGAELSRGLMVSLLRKQQSQHVDQLIRERQEIWKKTRAEAEERAGEELAGARLEVERFTILHQAFQKGSGVPLSNWADPERAESIGLAVRRVLNESDAGEEILRARHSAARILEKFDQELAELGIEP